MIERKQLIAALGAVVLAYGAAAVTQQLPPDLNVVCAVPSWQTIFETCEPDSNELLRELPPCEGLEVLLRGEERPAIFLQLYWHLLECRNAAAAWGLQTATYRADNSRGGFAEFEDFVNLYATFRIRKARDTELPSPTNPDTARTTVDLERLRADNGDPVLCTIEYFLTRSPNPPTWNIADSRSESC